jgi:hypothetical protein
MSYYTPPKGNTYGKKKKTTIDKRIVARKIVDCLNARMDANTKDGKDPLEDVATVDLMMFLRGLMPKESIGTVDHNINLITNTPRPQVIDVTPDKVRITGKETDGDGVDGSHNE